MEKSLIWVAKSSTNCGKLDFSLFYVQNACGLLYNYGNKNKKVGRIMAYTISEIANLWTQVLARIEEKLHEKRIFDTFFAETYISEIVNNTIYVVTNSAISAQLLSTQYLEMITETITEVTETNFKCVFIAESEIKNKQEYFEQTKKPTYFKDAAINPNLTFDNFVVGSFNREASQAALLVASNPGKQFNPLFIYSKSGLGKTHLMHAIGNYIQKVTMPNAKVLYINADDFVDEFVKFVKGEKELVSLKDFVSGFDVLLFDDVQHLAGKVKTQEMFFYIFEKMVNSNKQIVITSDKQPNELDGLEERLITRFSKGLVLKINDPDQNTCVEILRKKIIANNLDIDKFDESVLIFFAEKFSKNVRELEGALQRLIFYVINYKQTDTITMDVAIEATSSLLGGKSIASQLSEQKIINTVADYYNLPPSQLTGKIRTGQIALARHVAMYLIRDTLDIPLKKIGDAFGGKDHTTVMNALTKVDKELKTDPGLKEAIDELKKRLKQ